MLEVVDFQVRVRFGGVRIRKSYVEVSLWLERRVKHPTLVRTTAFSEIGSHGFAHYFHFTGTEQVDRQFAELARLSEQRRAAYVKVKKTNSNR